MVDQIVESSESTDEEVLDGQEQSKVDPDRGLSPIEDDPNDEESGDDTSNDDTDESSGESKEEKAAKKEADGVQKKINKMHREKKEAEERAESERAARVEAERKYAEATKVELKEIPPIPDYLDPDRDAKMAERDRIIIAHATESARKEAENQASLQRLQATQRTHAEKVNAAVEASYEGASTLKIDKKEFDASQAVLGTYLKGKADLAMYLLEDSDGPLNITYLAQNLPELDKVSKMTQTQAAVYIATKVTPQAKKLKPKTTNTPKPPNHPRGNKNVRGDDPRIKGATFT